MEIKNNAPILTVEGLNVSYGNLKAVVNVAFEVRAGEIFGLLGPNGAGKTSSLSAVEGLIIPQSGNITVAGFNTKDKPLHDVQLILLIGQYAQEYYLGDTVKESLTASVKNFSDYLPQYFLLPHPSPRNNIWQAKNKWFALKVLPELKKRVSNILSA